MLKKFQIIAVVCILLISTSTTAYSSTESIEEKALKFVELLGDGEFDIAFDMCSSSESR